MRNKKLITYAEVLKRKIKHQGVLALTTKRDLLRENFLSEKRNRHLVESPGRFNQTEREGK